MNQTSCLNCGESLTGTFCHACGQKKIEDQERTLKHFLYQFFGAAFFLENNFFKNLWYLIARPGFLAREYLEGRRKQYMPPISLFLLINLIYFFSVSLSDMNLTLREQMHQPLHGFLAKYMVEGRLDSREIALEEYKEDYNDQSTSLSKTLIILHAPILALLLIPLYWKKKIYYIDHVIFALYLMAFVMMFSILVFNGLLWMIRLSVISSDLFFPIYGFLQMTILPLHFLLAIKRFYHQKWFYSALKGVLVLALLMFAHLVYRALLFMIVFWTT